MARFRILSTEKKKDDTTDLVREALESAYPDWRVENLVEVDGEWNARLVESKVSQSTRTVVADAPPWAKDKDGGDDDSSDSDDGGDDSDSDSDSDDGDDDSGDEGSKDKGRDKKSPSKSKDPVAEVTKVISELQSLLDQLGGGVSDLQAAHDEKADKLKEISDSVGDLAPDGDGPDAPEGPGGPPVPGGLKGGSPGAPKGPLPVPETSVPGRPSAFSSRRTQIAEHSGFDAWGQKVSFTQVAKELEDAPEFVGYNVIDIQAQPDGSYKAKLELK